MKNLFFSLLILQSAFPAVAQNAQSPVAVAVFKDSKTKASIVEQNKICKELQLAMGPDHSLTMGADFPVSVEVYPTDLNKDGLEELFLVFGSTSLYGMTGEGFELYMQNKSGSFMRMPDVSGQGRPAFFTSSSQGYPDYMLGGPGFEFPVYRWNGKTYVYQKTIKDAVLSVKKVIGLDSLSNVYKSNM